MTDWADLKASNIRKRMCGLSARAQNQQIASALRESAKDGAVWALGGLRFYVQEWGEWKSAAFVRERIADIEAGKVEVKPYE